MQTNRGCSYHFHDFVIAFLQICDILIMYLCSSGGVTKTILACPTGKMEVYIMGNKKCCSLKTFFIIIGAVVSIGALIAVLYTVFKKYFKITFECDGDCDCCEEECFECDEGSYEPICCCHEEDTVAEEAGEDEISF